jgi:hypothetical protein
MTPQRRPGPWSSTAAALAVLFGVVAGCGSDSAGRSDAEAGGEDEGSVNEADVAGDEALDAAPLDGLGAEDAIRDDVGAGDADMSGEEAGTEDIGADEAGDEWTIEVPRERIPAWNPGVEGGIPDVAAVTSVRDHGARCDGSTDDSAAFNAAIDAAAGAGGGAVLVPDGVCVIRHPLTMRGGVVLRGAGPERSRLHMDITDSSNGGIDIHGGWAADEHALTGGYGAGSTEVVAADLPADLVAGRHIVVFEDNDPELMYTRPDWDQTWAQDARGQVVRVTAISGTRLTVDAPLRLAYEARFSPRFKLLAEIEGVGVEDLYVHREDRTESSIIGMTRAVNCWVRNVESDHCTRAHLWVDHARFVTVEGSFFHDSWDYGAGGHGYGVTLGRWATDCLVTNNGFRLLRHGMMVKEGANGNVFSYNYSHSADLDWSFVDFSAHGHYPYMNLWEGNVGDRAGITDWWGPAGPSMTMFRNRILREIYLADASPDVNLIGNTLLGESITVDATCRRAWVEANLLLGAAAVIAPAADTTQVENVVRPAGDIPDWRLPASLYLDGPPPFWGARPWPAIGADVDILHTDGSFPAIPAQERYAP